MCNSMSRWVFFSFLKCLVLVICIIPAGSGATEEPPRIDTNGKWEYTLVDGGAVIAQNHEITLDANLVIPSELDGYPVIGIGKMALYKRVNIVSITIPDSVTTIGYAAFSECTGLTSITIPNGVTSIASEAFAGCTSLISFTIPERVVAIERSTFYKCTSLTSISIPNSVISIGDNAFKGCSGLTNIFIPNTVVSIGHFAFEGCTNLTSIAIPYGVTTIGNLAFAECKNLANVNIPDSVIEIGGWAFYECTSLTSITIPNSVEYIAETAFENCTNLALIVSEDSVAEQYAEETNIPHTYGVVEIWDYEEFHRNPGKNKGTVVILEGFVFSVSKVKDDVFDVAVMIGHNFAVGQIARFRCEADFYPLYGEHVKIKARYMGALDAYFGSEIEFEGLSKLELVPNSYMVSDANLGYIKNIKVTYQELRRGTLRGSTMNLRGVVRDIGIANDGELGEGHLLLRLVDELNNEFILAVPASDELRNSYEKEISVMSARNQGYFLGEDFGEGQYRGIPYFTQETYQPEIAQ